MAEIKEYGPVTLEAKIKAANGDTNVVLTFLKSDHTEELTSVHPYSVGVSGLYYYKSQFREAENVGGVKTVTLEEMDGILRLVTPNDMLSVRSLKETCCTVIVRNRGENQVLRDKLRGMEGNEEFKHQLDYYEAKEDIQRQIAKGSSSEIIAKQLMESLEITEEKIREKAVEILQHTCQYSRSAVQALNRITKMEPAQVSQLFQRFFNPSEIRDSVERHLTDQIYIQDDKVELIEMLDITIRLKCKEIYNLLEKGDKIHFDHVVISSGMGNLPLGTPWRVQFLKTPPPKQVFAVVNGLIKPVDVPQPSVVIKEYSTYSPKLPEYLSYMFERHANPWWFSGNWWTDQMWSHPELEKRVTGFLKKGGDANLELI